MVLPAELVWYVFYSSYSIFRSCTLFFSLLGLCDYNIIFNPHPSHGSKVTLNCQPLITIPWFDHPVHRPFYSISVLWEAKTFVLYETIKWGLHSWSCYQEIVQLVFVSTLKDWRFSTKYQPSGARALAHHLQHCTAWTPHHLLNQKWTTGSGNRSNLRLLDPPINFR